MSILDALRNSRQNRSQAIEKVASQSNRSNEFYYPQRDKNGASSVTIRFLPQKDFNKLPFVLKYSHFFKGDDGRWKIVDLCPTTLGKNCPICEKNSDLWSTGIEANKKIVSARKRKKEYICNILVIDDPESPEKNGTVQLFKFGPAIFNLLETAQHPKFEDDPCVDPFDLLENGANFNLRIYKDETKNGLASYDRSRFLTPSALFDGDESKLEDLISKLHDLDTYVSEDNLKTEDELNKIVQTGYGGKGLSANNENTNFNMPVAEVKETKVELPKFEEAKDEDIDDSLAEFRRLVK